MAAIKIALNNIRSVLVIIVLFSAVTAFNERRSSFHFIDRASWGAVNATDVRPLKTPVPYVVIHHTYIPAACFTLDDCKKDMRSMQKYHMSRGWGDIGYNFCVGTEGSVFEGRGWSTVGVHAGRANNVSVGICLIGDWREELPPPDTLQVTKDLISEGIKLGVISAEYKLIGHQQAMATECPGKALMEEIETWPHYQSGHINFTLH